MIKLFKKSFVLLKENMILIQPLIIFLLVMTFAFLPLKSLQNNHMAFYGVFLNIILLTIAFLSGWFGMIKKVILSSKFEQNDKIEPFKLLKDFFPAVGEYFLPMCGGAIVYTSITILFAILVFKVGTYFFSDINLLVQMFNQTMQPIAVQKEFLNSLNPAQIMLLNKWILYFVFWYFLFNLLVLFYPAIILLKTKNPLKALWLSFTSVFKKPLTCVVTYLYLLILSFAVSSFGLLGNINLLLSFISLFISLMFITYYIMVIFLTYEEYCNSYNRSDS